MTPAFAGASNKLVSVADSIAKWNNRKREMMERIKPNYYDRFTCIADKCTFTCCQEWKIASGQQRPTENGKRNIRRRK